MNYKQFYIIKERAFFTNLFKLITLVLEELKNQIEKTGSVRPGRVYKVSLGDGYDLDVKFYKGYSRSAREYMAKNSLDDVSALYFPKTTDSNGRIEIYINNSKKQTSYYKERKFEDFVNKSLPKYIKDIISHELTHAYEDIVRDVLKYKPDQQSNEKEYYSSDEEINAYITQYVYKILQDGSDVSNNVKFYIKQKNIKSACREIFSTIKDKKFVTNLDRDGKIKIIKIIYTIVTELVEKVVD